jgi:hypothetical protein
LSDHLRGAQRRAHDECEAERLLELALATLELSEEEFPALRVNRAGEQASGRLAPPYWKNYVCAEMFLGYGLDAWPWPGSLVGIGGLAGAERRWLQWFHE